MAVVSEPPWLNQSSGTAARNGTTSHTISFGFTSTSGSLLVFVVFGAVTHTVSGWTEQLSPVNSGELSVFTKTSAGDTDITVTHNGSNYPVTWAAYEFPAGSSYTAGTSDSASSDAYPALSGLPGTEQVIIAARGRTAASASETSASAAWSAPWVEDADQFVAFATTDGGHLTVAHQINVTSTSITPTDTPTYGGSWGTPDREKVVFALDVAAGSPEVAATGVAVAAAVAFGAVVKTVPVVGRCVASAAAAATAVKVTPAVARSLAAPAGYVTAARAAIGAGVATAAPTGAAVTVKRLSVSGAAVAAFTAVGVAAQPGGPQSASGRCSAMATCTGRAGRRTLRPNSGITSRPFTGITFRP